MGYAAIHLWPLDFVIVEGSLIESFENQPANANGLAFLLRLLTSIL